MSKTALIVIDVQRGMFAFPDQPPHDGEAVLSRIADLVARARETSTPLIFVQHDGGAGHPLEKPTEGWGVHPGTGYRAGDAVVEKRYPDAFQDTNLQERLADLDVSTLILTGMMTEYCVDTTCRRAFSLGYDVILASDAHTTFSKPGIDADMIVRHHNEVLGNGFAKVEAAADIEFKQYEALQ